MVIHHPSSNLLLEHAAGTSSWAVSLSISAHLQMCPQCRHQVNHLNHVGGALLVSSAPEEPAPGLFHQIMYHIEEDGDEPEQHHESSTENFQKEDEPAYIDSRVQAEQHLSAPKAVRQLLRGCGSLQWTEVSSTCKVAPLIRDGANDDQSVVLCCLSGGGKAPTRRGVIPKISLILAGYASNDEGLYSPGDFIAYTTERSRQVVATQNEDCVYLSVAERESPEFDGWLSHTWRSMSGNVRSLLSH